MLTVLSMLKTPPSPNTKQKFNVMSDVSLARAVSVLGVTSVMTDKVVGSAINLINTVI